jgi:hypothetical protein
MRFSNSPGARPDDDVYATIRATARRDAKSASFQDSGFEAERRTEGAVQQRD